jgi:hypothetical protein
VRTDDAEAFSLFDTHSLRQQPFEFFNGSLNAFCEKGRIHSNGSLFSRSRVVMAGSFTEHIGEYVVQLMLETVKQFCARFFLASV